MFGMRMVTIVLALTAVAAAASCQPAFRSTEGSWTVGAITQDGMDRYEFFDQGKGLKITAPATNKSINLRLAAVKQSTATSLNHESCATWHGPVASIVQPGVVLRARLDAERTQAILVTNNIWSGVRSTINVHVADTAAKPALTGLATIDMTRAMGPYDNLKPLPWRLCARASGSTVTIKVWSITAHPTEPAWNDPTHTASVQLPARGVYSGKPGVFMGHLSAGQSTVLSNHTTRTN